VCCCIGCLFENVPLYDEMLVYDYLAFIAEVRGVPSDQRRAQIKRVVELTGLTAMIARPIQELSKGYRQRVGLAQAIIHEPDVVILDEPTGGLDPNQILDIRDVIKRIGQEKTVLFSTHIMQEVEAVCDRVILINRGRIVANDTIAALRAQLASTRPGLLITVDAARHDAAQLTALLGAIKAVDVVHLDGEPIADEVEARVEAADLEQARRAILALGASGELALKRIGPFEPSLEAIFRHFTYDAEPQAPDDLPAALVEDAPAEEAQP
jgi:ABC-2 type transport system ATP-binding protein